MRSLCLLPGGPGRFVPCSFGANHCRHRHIGWEKCGHGLTSRLQESASEGFVNKLLVLFGYPNGSAAALLLGFYPSGIVLPSLLVNSLRRSFLTGAMLVSWSLRVTLMIRYLWVKGFVVLLFQALLVVLVYSEKVGFLGTQQENTSTPCKTLWFGRYLVSFQGLEGTVSSLLC